MKRSIVTDRVFLTKKCELVTETELPGIIQDLEDSFVGVRGYGLSANQIGIQKQVAIIRVGEVNNPGYWKLDLINPVIVSKDGKTVFPKEGCLSFPGIRIDTSRYNEIIIETGFEPERKRYYHYGLESVILQHECGHLMGQLIFDFKHKARK